MKLHLTNNAGTWDVTMLVPAVTWSGDYQDAARRLDFSLLAPLPDEHIPAVECPLGSAVQLYEGDTLLFDGFVFSRTKNTEQSQISLTCFDRGIYLKRNRVSKKYSGKTPEAIVRELAAEFGMEAGAVAETGVPVSRNFFGAALYDIILTAYTLASRRTGATYNLRFRGAKLCVSASEPDSETLLLQGKCNLINATTTESVQNMVNAVGIYDTNDKLVRIEENAEYIKLYGRMQEYRKQTRDDNMRSAARKLLAEKGVEQKITVNSLGDARNTAGGFVAVEEPYTGLTGLFFFESDTHEWKRGQYYNKLTLSFKRMMDEKEAGSDA